MAYKNRPAEDQPKRDEWSIGPRDEHGDLTAVPPADYPIDQPLRMTLADAITDSRFDRVWIGAKWNQSSQDIAITVRTYRDLTSDEAARLVQMMTASHEPAAKVFADFERTLDQPLHFVAYTSIDPSRIDLDLLPDRHDD